MQTHDNLARAAVDLQQEPLIKGQMNREYHEWTTRTRFLLLEPYTSADKNMHAYTEDLGEALQNTDHPLGKDLGNRLTQLAKMADPDEGNRSFNPFVILKKAEDTRMFLQGILQKARGQGFGDTQELSLLVAHAEQLLDTYLRILANPPGYLNQPRSLRGHSTELSAQRATILQAGAVFILAPTALGLLGLAFFDKDPKSQASRLQSGLLWSGALVAACLGHKLFTTDPDGRIRTTTASDTWATEVAVVANGEFERLASNPAYGIRNPALSAEWATFTEKLSTGEGLTQARKYLNKRTPLTSQEEELVCEAFDIPEGPFREAIRAMMHSDTRTAGGHAGDDFRSYVGMFRKKRSEQARQFIDSYIRTASGPADLDALRMQTDMQI